MSSRIVYGMVGAIVGAVVDLLINLLAAGIQQQSFGDQFSEQSIWWLVALICAGLLVGGWLGMKVTLPVSPSMNDRTKHSNIATKTVTLTRLRAFLSYTKLRGQGVHLNDIVSLGSILDIDTRE